MISDSTNEVISICAPVPICPAIYFTPENAAVNADGKNTKNNNCIPARIHAGICFLCFFQKTAPFVFRSFDIQFFELFQLYFLTSYFPNFSSLLLFCLFQCLADSIPDPGRTERCTAYGIHICGLRLYDLWNDIFRHG